MFTFLPAYGVLSSAYMAAGMTSRARRPESRHAAG